MGVYNYVKFKARCRKCGCEINSWQTKDNNKYDLCFFNVPHDEVGEFYTICENCDTWNEYRWVDGKLILIDCDEVMDYVKCKKCQWSWDYIRNKDEYINGELFIKKGYYLQCPFYQSLYFEKEPVELLRNNSENCCGKD